MLGSSVIHIILQACWENSSQEMNKGNKIEQSEMVFRQPQKQMTHTRNRKRYLFGYMHLS